MYRFKKASLSPTPDITAIMNGQTGNEGRFAGRFKKYAGTAESFTKSADVTGQAIEDLRVSAGMITGQKQGIDRLFLLAERAVSGISNLESSSGIHQVDNIPLPGDNVRSSYGKKMGYVALNITFLAEGLLHFMEETINLQQELESRDTIISKLAAQIPSMEIIGAFEEVSLNDLTGVAPIDVATYTKSDKAGPSDPKKQQKKKN